MISRDARWTRLSTMALAVLAVVASGVGLGLDGVYRDNALVTSGWLGNDVVTLVLAVPVLVASDAIASRGSARARLVWLGAVQYLLYNYAFYLFGAAFNALFLAYAALVAGSLYTLVASLVTLAPALLPPARARRGVATWMGLLALILGALWTLTSLAYLATGEVPPIVVAVDHPTNLIAALDLTMVVPLNALGAWLLARRDPWGLVAAAIANVKGALYMAVLTASTLTAFWADAAEGAGLAVLWAAIGLGCLTASFALLRSP